MRTYIHAYIYIYIYGYGCALCVLDPPPPPMLYKGLKPRGLEDPHDRRAAPRIVPSLAHTPKNGTEA